MAGPAPLEFILCADDFGISPGVSEGIIELVQGHRLSAVSCMMNGRSIRKYADGITPYRDRIDIGIHFVLTDMPPLSSALTLEINGRLPTIGALTKRALIGGLPLEDLKSELAAQLDLFADIFKRRPDFVDGHQHIHQLPGIRDIVLDLIMERFSSCLPPLRSCSEHLSIIFRRGVEPLKTIAIGFFGASLQRGAMANNVKFNTGFSGIYDLSGKVAYEVLFDRFTDSLRPGSLIMCHPGKVDDELRSIDGLTDQREVELSYFLGNIFTDLLAKKNLRLGRFATFK